MPTPRPDPTPAQVMSQLQLAGGRVVPAVDELLAIQQRVLPGVVDYVNANRSLQLPKPQGYYVAGQVINGKWPALICAAEVDTQGMAPRQFADTINIMMFLAYDRFETRKQWADAYDLAYLVRGILTWFVRNQYDNHNRQLWTQLVPTGITTIPGRWSDYRGFAVHLQMFQAPHNDLWT